MQFLDRHLGSEGRRWAMVMIAALLCLGALGVWLRDRALEPSRAAHPFRVSSHDLPSEQGVPKPVVDASNEVFKEACVRRHIPFEVVKTEGSPIKAILDRKIDLTQVIFDSPENRKQIYISEPWALDSAWMVALESTGIDTPAEVVGKRVWIQDNPRHKYLAWQNLHGADIALRDSFEKAVEGICQGQTDAALVEPLTADSRAFFERLPACRDKKLSFSELPNGRIWFGVGGHKDPATKAAVNAIREEIGRMAEDGTLGRIYLNFGLDPNNAVIVLHDLNILRQRDRYMMFAVAILLLVMLALIFQGFRLRKARRLADKLNAAKSEFLANMSHELRTPLNSVIGMTRLALETDVTSERKEFLSIASASAESLLSVVNVILDFSKLETGKLGMEELVIDLCELVESSAKVFAFPAHQKGLELVCDVALTCPRWIQGDPVRLRQVLFNLIGNAVKFTPKGEVRITVSPRATDRGPVLEFTVQDTGIGIAHEKLAVIFEPFSQADTSTTRKFGGTGLGLAISRALVKLMGGSIGVESSPGQGSSFRFTVPMHALTVHSEWLGENVEGRALVVDDNSTARAVLERMLRYWGLEVATVADGESALEVLERAKRAGQPYSLLVIDSELPSMDGFELASLVQSQFGLGHAIVMMLTSDKCNLTAGRCAELGIVAHLIKPIGRAELLAGARRVLHVGPDVPEPPQTSRIMHERPARSLRILLAEDNAVNRKLATTILQRAGHIVSTAENGREAIERMRSGKFDLVLMDVQMPEVDGLEAARAIRREEARTGAHVAMIAMTAHAMSGDIERCLASGMDGYIAKPFQPRDFLETIEAVKSKLDREELPSVGND
ncbi:MAG TPA: response regulator [Terriglobales bacterium]|nr:response regulator [Terriglobales bacterium]